MLNLGQNKHIENPASLFEGQTGTYHVWGPEGDVHKFLVENGRITSINYLKHSNRPDRDVDYIVEKIADQPEDSKAAKAGRSA